MINILTVLNDTLHKSNHAYEFKAILTTALTHSEEHNIPVYHAQVVLRCFDIKRNTFCDINIIRKTGYSVNDIDLDDLYNAFYTILYQNIMFSKHLSNNLINTEGKITFALNDILCLVLTDKELPI